MRYLLKNEFSRLWKSKLLYVVCAINLFIVGLHIYSEVIPSTQWGIATAGYPLTVFEKWIGGETSSIFPMLYFMLSPLMMAIPYGGTLQEDLKSGYVKNVFTRGRRRDYLIAKYIVTFSTGFIAVLPLIVNFLLTATILPADIPQASTGFYPIDATSLAGELFYTHPYVYLGLWLLMDILFYGLLATLSLFAGLLSEYAYVAILTPFLVCMVLYGASVLAENGAVAPTSFLAPSQMDPANPLVIIGETILLLLVGGGYYYVGKKKEIY